MFFQHKELLYEHAGIMSMLGEGLIQSSKTSYTLFYKSNKCAYIYDLIQKAKCRLTLSPCKADIYMNRSKTNEMHVQYLDRFLKQQLLDVITAKN
jgi:hypothetical protein